MCYPSDSSYANTLIGIAGVKTSDTLTSNGVIKFEPNHHMNIQITKNSIEQVDESTNMPAMISHKFVMHLPRQELSFRYSPAELLTHGTNLHLGTIP